MSGAFLASDRRLSPLLIVLVVVLGYGIAPTRLPLVGEETCRAQHGIEMAESGNWLVATNQYVPILDRPPMHYWMLAVIHKWVHKLDPLTLRLSMTAITLITSLAIWWYAKGCLSTAGAFLAAVAYPTMGHVFDLGRRAETDGLFALLLAGSLLVWHRGYSHRWPGVWTWSAAGFLAALAALTKGFQGPVAFFGAIYLFLLIRRDWRCALHWSHFVGWVVFAATIAVWQVPFYLQTGWKGTRLTWFHPFTSRQTTDVVELLVHMLEFPFVVVGAALPWSVLLLGLLHPAFWRLDERVKSAVWFMLAGIASIFGPVWLSRYGHQRYVMAMYPLMAVVCGAVVQQALALDMKCALRKLWCGYVRGLAVVIAGFVAVFAVATGVATFTDAEWAQRLAQPWWLTAVMVAGATAGTVVVHRLSTSEKQDQAKVVALTLAALLAICFNGAIVNARAHTVARIGPEVAALRDRLPDEPALVSFELLPHQFIYYYEKRVPIVRLPKKAKNVPDELEYFAITVTRDQPAQLPFEWEEIARVSMDRRRSDNPNTSVVIGRRIAASPPSGGDGEHRSVGADGVRPRRQGRARPRRQRSRFASP